jgi:hypothetical protein
MLKLILPFKLFIRVSPFMLSVGFEPQTLVLILPCLKVAFYVEFSNVAAEYVSILVTKYPLSSTLFFPRRRPAARQAGKPQKRQLGW